ncbi:MAG: hypothetical protein KIT83_03260 [Bryobacterales bacterium]|nr:hypothetical protein [Bryobacterales bacterium]
MKSSGAITTRLQFLGFTLGILTALWFLAQVALPLPGQETAAKTPLVESMQDVRRVCVEEFEGGENARQLRGMLIDQLRRLGAFVVTENPARADAFLRGFAEDLVYTEQHSRDENVGARGQASASTGGYTRNRRAVSSGVGANESVRERSTERRHEAALTVRIVNADGDVLWSGSAESRGGKYRSAGADVSARIAAALEKALKGKADSGPNTATDSADSPVSVNPAPD